MNKKQCAVKTRMIVNRLLEQLKICVFEEMPDARYDIEMIEFTFEQISDYNFMQLMVEFILPHAHVIRRGDKQFASENLSYLFESLPATRVSFYKEFFLHHLDPDHEKTIIQYFQVILTMTERYRKLD